MNPIQTDAVIIGAGAAGLMCAISAAEQGKQVYLLDHANKAGKKILISGGGRCNFTNMYTEPGNYLSNNPHFCKSALNRYTPWDFIAEVDKASLPWHEKKLGQLFSDNKSQAVLAMLLDRCEEVGVNIVLNYSVDSVDKINDQFIITNTTTSYQCHALVIATGAMSFPTMGATDFGHRLAKKFGLKVTHTYPGLVPFTFDGAEKKQFQGLSGISIDTDIEVNNVHFRENILFTHKGLSGPAVLQISSYWKPGDKVTVRCIPDVDMASILKDTQQTQPNKHLHTILQTWLPLSVLQCLCDNIDLQKPLHSYKHSQLQEIARLIQHWQFIPSGTEGYKKAEVTCGGVDTDEISSKTFETKKVPGLYFIGEVLDVTGQLGGFNFQWAWASGFCCGQSLAI
ncbi:MAG: NAD(P)/FAD-dependent oxidoreductase [Oceanicoccus sp.]|uniref:NAD(P)/FAD-dependent oxidoreductase n=1 Tax=Oceanicoccus sp. TaxID=2691044 RepID=UPI00261C8C1A|nr:NAD(P)/FAD-dependent oxidoreductase [Oceanicoccus sp.]MCP3908173.1 NAD(P)/FAD-dependent oxidoreductase [Oceanicoccus sp.]MDG1773927.1 NAD(P)/FAD-dependent oxidoreductase [Oceanicoccus sp.]